MKRAEAEKRKAHVASPRSVFSGSPKRVFLDWKKTPLAGAAEWIFHNGSRNPRSNPAHLPPPKLLNCGETFSQLDSAAATQSGRRKVDLSQNLVVIPTARARRRLLQRLCQVARQQRAALLPPTIVTVGSFPEKLYENAQPLADQTTRLLTWLEAFQDLPLAERQLFLPRLTASNLRRELSFAEQLVELHVRLGAEVRSFRSVHEHLEKNPGLGDPTRWAVLARVQASYYERLSRLGLWDVQAARNVAIRKQLCKFNGNIILVGAVDLSESNRQMLRQLGSPVTALIFAPEEYANRFDDVGGLLPDAWLSHKIEIPDSCLTFADRYADQADAVLQSLRNLNGRYAADQITIGVPDDEVLPALELALENSGLNSRRLEGERFRECPAFRFAEALSRYLDRSDFSLFAQLIRHPDLSRWLDAQLGQANWLPAVDEFQANYLASKLSWAQPIAVPPDVPAAVMVSRIHAALQNLLRPFLETTSPSLAEISRAWQIIAGQVYPQIQPDTADSKTPDEDDAEDATGAQQLAASLRGIEHFALKSRAGWSGFALANAQAATPAEAIDLALAVGPRSTSGDPADRSSIELVGWLDLPLDDAPVLIVTAMNEEAISSEDPVLPLLPSALLESLGMGQIDHRNARNHYALSLAVQSREHVRLICGRHDGAGNPILISRLLLAEEDDTLVARVNSFFSFEGEQNRRKWLKPPEGFAVSQTLGIPRPEQVPEQSTLSVTRFRDYIKCPYRFYLNAILRLEPVRDSLREMDGGAFGSVAHNVLEAFGRNKIRNSEDPEQIRKFLETALEREADSFRQQSWFAAVEVQLESLRERLKAFAEIQAEHRAAGWEIIAVEQAAKYTWTGSGVPFLINGRIDRVDRHRDGRLAVWDYKTSDKGVKVNAAHRDAAGNWRDLQLPLYRYLIESVSEVGAEAARVQRDSLQLGYILLPRTIKDVAFDQAHWDPHELSQADQLTSEIVNKIQQLIFWPPNPEPPEYSEQYAAICQDFVFDRSKTNG